MIRKGQKISNEYKNQKIVNLLKNEYGDLSNMTILDAGGGHGYILNLLPDMKKKVVVDINKDNVSSDNYNIIANLSNLPFNDNSFDLCIFSEVIEHLDNPIPIVKELTRVSHNIILTTPNNCLSRKLLRRCLLYDDPDFVGDRHKDDDPLGKGHIKEYNSSEIIEIFNSVNFYLYRFEALGFVIPQLKIDCFPKLSAKMLMLFKKVGE